MKTHAFGSARPHEVTAARGDVCEYNASGYLLGQQRYKPCRAVRIAPSSPATIFGNDQGDAGSGTYPTWG